MTDSAQDLLEIVQQLRNHLEFRKMLGVTLLDRGMAATRIVASTAADESTVVPPASRTAAPVVSRPAAESAVPSKIPKIVPEAPEAVTAHSSPAVSEPTTLDEIRVVIDDCQRCKLAKGRTHIVFGEGNANADVVFVGEGPGYEEDQQARPFVGAAGQLLTDIIVKGMKLRREDVYICNIVKCRPPGNRNPEPDEVEACIGFVKKQIAVIKPKVIVTLGNVPTQNLLGTKQGITKMRGTWQEYAGIPVMPTFHPSYLLRTPGDKKLCWEDIQKVMAKLGITATPGPSKQS